MNDHERGFLAFLAEPSRRRMRALLELGEKRRHDVRALLDHSVRLDPRFCHALTGSDAMAASLEVLLLKRGAAPSCYILAVDAAIDRTEMSVGEALRRIIGSGNGAFVSCIPGRLGLYAYEETNATYLLSR